jgi:hypothetical protein
MMQKISLLNRMVNLNKYPYVILIGFKETTGAKPLLGP